MLSIILWLGAVTDPGGLDPTGGAFTVLGPFAAAAAALGFGWWRAEKRNDRLQAALDATVPALIENRHAQQTTITSLQAATAANERLATTIEANTAELVRLRDMVVDLERGRR